MPQVPLVQVRVPHSVSVPGQSVGRRHWRQCPLPSQTPPLPHAPPDPALVVPQAWLLQVAMTQSLPVAGQSLGESQNWAGGVQTPLMQFIPPGQSLVFLHVMAGEPQDPLTQD
jgi:hypothetical protein